MDTIPGFSAGRASNHTLILLQSEIPNGPTVGLVPTRILPYMQTPNCVDLYFREDTAFLHLCGKPRTEECLVRCGDTLTDPWNIHRKAEISEWTPRTEDDSDLSKSEFSKSLHLTSCRAKKNVTLALTGTASVAIGRSRCGLWISEPVRFVHYSIWLSHRQLLAVQLVLKYRVTICCD